MSNSRSFRRRMIRLQLIPGWDRSLRARWVIKNRRRGRYANLKQKAQERNSVNG